MGKLVVIKSGPLATVQDRGRFGLRRYGIPQSGAIDVFKMEFVNRCLGKQKHMPVIEFALMGLKLQASERTAVAFAGCSAKLNGKLCSDFSVYLEVDDILELSPPVDVYGYFTIGGALNLDKVFGSYSTYLPAKFGGIEGRSLKKGDVLESKGEVLLVKTEFTRNEHLAPIRYMKGPEWKYTTGTLDTEQFQVAPPSNRIGVRLEGLRMECKVKEIKSSAVVPGTIQLPPDGQPIVLMNDCQTTGGYPRLGKVVDEDLGKLAQVRAGNKVRFNLISLS